MPLDHVAQGVLLSKVHALVLPHLVAIYSPLDDHRVQQVGTGICFDVGDKQFLVTARHALFGQGGDENPGDKAFFATGRLRQIADLQSPDVFSSPAADLAAVELIGSERRCALTQKHLHEGSTRPTFITICGYLARDFRRHQGTLEPKPYAYSNYSIAMPRGFIGLRHPKRRNRDPLTRRLVMIPTPRGLSGGPMLDSACLAIGKLSVVGIFTDKPEGKGVAFGEASQKVRAMLQVLGEQGNSHVRASNG